MTNGEPGNGSPAELIWKMSKACRGYHVTAAIGASSQHSEACCMSVNRGP